MRHAVWLTDLRFDFCYEDETNPDLLARYEEFLEHVLEVDPAVVLLGGDTAVSSRLAFCLKHLARVLQPRPVYFVLGNEDFWDSSIATVRREVSELCTHHAGLRYLSAATEPVALTKVIGLVGHDGWPDGRFAKNDMATSALPQDYERIGEFRAADKSGRWQLLNTLGDESAEHLRRLLSKAVERFQVVLLLTHVPPWLELAPHAMTRQYHNDHCASRSAGEAICSVMQTAPRCRLIVLCSHLHGEAEYHPLPNIVALSENPSRGYPCIMRTIDLAESYEELSKEFFA